MKELESFKNTLLWHKNEVLIKQIETQNNIVFKDLECKTNIMREDVKKIKNAKIDNRSEIEKMCDNFKQNLFKLKSEFRTSEANSIVKKIKAYCDRMSLSSLDLVKQLDKSVVMSMTVDLLEAKDTFNRLKILQPIETNNFLNLVRLYHGDKVPMDIFICILEMKRETQEEEELYCQGK